MNVLGAPIRFVKSSFTNYHEPLHFSAYLAPSSNAWKIWILNNSNQLLRQLLLCNCPMTFERKCKCAITSATTAATLHRRSTNAANVIYRRLPQFICKSTARRAARSRHGGRPMFANAQEHGISHLRAATSENRASTVPFSFLSADSLDKWVCTDPDDDLLVHGMRRTFDSS